VHPRAAPATSATPSRSSWTPVGPGDSCFCVAAWETRESGRGAVSSKLKGCAQSEGLWRFGNPGRLICQGEVAGSNPVFRSKKRPRFREVLWAAAFVFLRFRIGLDASTSPDQSSTANDEVAPAADNPCNRRVDACRPLAVNADRPAGRSLGTKLRRITALHSQGTVISRTKANLARPRRIRSPGGSRSARRLLV